MDCGDYYHEAQSGKSKRENRENNGHLVHKTFTPNKQKLKYNTNKKSKEKNGNEYLVELYTSIEVIFVFYS